MIPASYAPREPPPASTMPILGRDCGDCTASIVARAPEAAQPMPVARCLAAMKLALIAVVVTSGVARADTMFEEYGAHTLIRDADQLVETSCDLDVELRGAVATVEMRQKIANPGPTPLAASYEFELPLGAVM